MQQPGVAERNPARWKIIQEVNKHILSQHAKRWWRNRPEVRLLGMKNIQEAVCIARRRKLVDAETLQQAGFNVTP